MTESGFSTDDPQYLDLLRQYDAAPSSVLRDELFARYLELQRGGTTAHGLPYPNPTDPLTEGADAIRALAQAVDSDLANIDVSWGAITGKPPVIAAGVNETAARDVIGAAPEEHTHSAISSGGSYLRWTGTQWLANALFGIAAPLEVGGTATVGGPFLNPHGRNNGVASWLSLGINPSGQIGFQLSTRRFKKEIQSWTPDRQAILAMRLVQFRSTIDDETDHGLIAEELHDLGLHWLVAYDDDGLPVTVRYERIGLALLPIVQDHEARLRALEGP